jgi:hypothetical protein
LLVVVISASASHAHHSGKREHEGAQELIDNIMVFVNALMEALPSRDRLKAIQLHATRSPAFGVYSRPPPPNQGRWPVRYPVQCEAGQEPPTKAVIPLLM